MDSIQKWRKTKQPAPGFIPYGKYVYHDPSGIVYSLDKFRPRFPVSKKIFQDPDPKRPGFFLPPSEDVGVRNILEILNSILRMLTSSSEASFISCDNHGAGRCGNVHWWKFFGGIVTLHKFKPFGSTDYSYSLLMEFNPNKSDLEPWRLLRERCSDSWYNTRMDYALDIPFPISDVRLLTRKVGSSYQGTYYFGTRGSSGYTRVYDKRKEILDKQRLDIGQDVTRIEWESRAGDPLHMDYPYLIRDLGRYEVLRYVPMHDWPAALRTFDERTALKIRQSMLPIDVDQTVFDRLRNELLSDLGLDPARCLDHLDKKSFNASAMEDLEKIQSQLRKWAKVDH